MNGRLNNNLILQHRKVIWVNELTLGSHVTLQTHLCNLMIWLLRKSPSICICFFYTGVICWSFQSVFRNGDNRLFFPTLFTDTFCFHYDSSLLVVSPHCVFLLFIQ